MVHVDARLREATIAVLHERGGDGLTLERVAEVAGRARTTLWRQGLTRDALIEALAGGLAEDFRSSMFPILTAGGTRPGPPPRRGPAPPGGGPRPRPPLARAPSALRPARPPPAPPARDRRGIPPGAGARPASGL